MMNKKSLLMKITNRSEKVKLDFARTFLLLVFLFAIASPIVIPGNKIYAAETEDSEEPTEQQYVVEHYVNEADPDAEETAPRVASEDELNEMLAKEPMLFMLQRPYDNVSDAATELRNGFISHESLIKVNVNINGGYKDWEELETRFLQRLCSQQV